MKAFVVTGAGGNFCSGGDVFEIIGPLIEMNTTGPARASPRMTGEVVKAMRACPQPIVAAVDGVCAGAGAIIAMASDLRVGTRQSAKVAFLFNRVGLAGCDMGACAILPRIIGQGRAAELLYHRPRRWAARRPSAAASSTGCRRRTTCWRRRTALANELAAGPTFANGMTKRMLEMEWAMSVEQSIEAEAVAQALCMKTEDFKRAFHAFANKQKPVFEGD